MYVVVCTPFAQIVSIISYVTLYCTYCITYYVWLCYHVVPVFLFCKTGLSGHGRIVCVIVELVTGSSWYSFSLSLYMTLIIK